MSAQRRLIREYKKILEEDSKLYTCSIDPSNILKWKAVLFGPEGTDWEGAVFHLQFDFPDDYPHQVPQVHFVGTIPYHPNVYQNGKICLDLLQHNWSSAYGVSSILTAVQALLADPNPNSPANNEAAHLFTDKPSEYSRRIRNCVEATWTSSQ